MDILYAFAGKLSNAKFTKTIGSKPFSYVGDADEGFLIEELVFKSINLNHPETAKKRFQAVVETEDSLFLISFNDNGPTFDGENTVLYSLSEFSEEEIGDFIEDLIEDQNSLLFIKYNNGIMTISGDMINEDIVVNDKDITVEKLISNKTKFKQFFSKRFIEIVLLIILILIPVLTINPLKKGIIDNRDIKISSLKKELKILERSKLREEKKGREKIKKYLDIEKKKDIINKQEYNYIWR